MPSTRSRKLVPAHCRPGESAFRELLRVFGLLDRVMQPYFTQYGISGAQWGVLRTLQRAQEEGLPSLRLTDLSERLLIRPPSVTEVVDRLERAGFVERNQTPDDLRVKRVSLTSAGQQLVGRILEGHANQIDTVLGGLKPEEQDQLLALLSRLSQHLKGLIGQAVASA